MQNGVRKEQGKEKGGRQDVFGDQRFAEALRIAYRSLAGPGAWRVLSARQVRYIRILRFDAQNGSEGQDHISRFLNSDSGREGCIEEDLWELYNNPSRGKGRYTWIEHARNLSRTLHTSTKHSGDENSAPHTTQQTPVLTLQFVHTFSILRILSVLAVILATSVAAALLWIFLGKSGWGNLRDGGRGERVGAGMLVALVALVVQGLGFAVWMGVSWVWVPR
ncbi:hypothetical protein M011DRAFT_409617 [Sporormia fimetaria CBS 119925]|uniref:Uncharacterized protein n=1 Tax=Sporormia fimetaria CBS 119925 TaxID=1340428 RepID=A0A6A6V1D4_9PLEO|nr:hypothetical protein M011DRAFT_409617 [Sporormia fimetaria CBS 119925]